MTPFIAMTTLVFGGILTPLIRMVAVQSNSEQHHFESRVLLSISQLRNWYIMQKNVKFFWGINH